MEYTELTKEKLIEELEDRDSNIDELKQEISDKEDEIDQLEEDVYRKENNKNYSDFTDEVVKELEYEELQGRLTKEQVYYHKELVKTAEGKL